eukprot:scaffold13517_cov112-Isochrysis_galbana.AAC.1
MRCFLCATCELRPPASQWSEERRFEWFAQAHNKLVRNKSARAVDPANALSRPPVVATSWAQSTLPFYSVGAVPEPVRRLRAWLDSPAYTSAVYGPSGTVPPASELRVVWLSLLPPAALRQLASVGVCARVAPVPPLSPFFSNIGIHENPTNALWVARPDPRPAPPHSW